MKELSKNTDNRMISGNIKTEDTISSNNLRPNLLKDFIGQDKIKSNLNIFIFSAKKRGENLDHLLFHGPPGLGKTTLSHIISKELEVGIKYTSGPMLSKTGDLAAILTGLEVNDILFIDEIHRLSTTVEEVLYSAMEDFYIDIVIGEGVSARTVRIDLPKFTLIGATTRLGMLSNPLKDRFGIPLKLNFYNSEELSQVVIRGAKLLGLNINIEATKEIANVSRGTPRVALRILRRVRDFACHKSLETIDLIIVQETLKNLDINSFGLDALDYQYINYIAKHYYGGPVGIETIAAGLSEDKDTIEEIIEPYLMQIGFMQRTPRGRLLSKRCINKLNILITKTKDNTDKESSYRLPGMEV